MGDYSITDYLYINNNMIEPRLEKRIQQIWDILGVHIKITELDEHYQEMVYDVPLDSIRLDGSFPLMDDCYVHPYNGISCDENQQD